MKETESLFEKIGVALQSKEICSWETLEFIKELIEIVIEQENKIIELQEEYNANKKKRSRRLGRQV